MMWFLVSLLLLSCQTTKLVVAGQSLSFQQRPQQQQQQPPEDPDVIAAANCLKPTLTFQAYLSVDAPGDPYGLTDADLEAVKTTFISKYNELSAFNCDGLNRRAVGVDIQIYDVFTDSQTLINFIFRVTWTCNGDDCPRRQLFSLEQGFLGRGDKNSTKNPPPPPPPNGQTAQPPSPQNTKAPKTTPPPPPPPQTNPPQPPGGSSSPPPRPPGGSSSTPPPPPPPQNRHRDLEQKDADLERKKSVRGQQRHHPNVRGTTSRFLQATNADCGVCDTYNPTRKSPSPRQFVDAFRDAVVDLNLAALAPITNILEIELRQCPADEDNILFEETVVFEVEGDPNNVTAADKALLEDTFTSSYNYFSQVSCDGRFLQVRDAQIIGDPLLEDPLSTRRELQTLPSVSFNFTSFISQLIFYLKAIIRGSCRFCTTDYSLVSNDASRTRFRSLMAQHGIKVKSIKTTRKLRPPSNRRLFQFLSNSEVNMGEYLEAMKKDCKSCGDPPTVTPSASPTRAPITGPPSTSKPTRTLPGVRILGSEDCFCAKQDPNIGDQQVAFNDAFNTTFLEERNDGRYRGLNQYRATSFGGMGSGGSAGGGGDGSGGGDRGGRSGGGGGG